MTTRLKRFDVYQTSKVSAIIYFFITAIFMIPAGLITSAVSSVAPSGSGLFPFSGIFMIFVPFLYAVMGFIVTALSCLVYNFIASKTGGIAFELETTNEGEQRDN